MAIIDVFFWDAYCACVCLNMNCCSEWEHRRTIYTSTPHIRCQAASIAVPGTSSLWTTIFLSGAKEDWETEGRTKEEIAKSGGKHFAAMTGLLAKRHKVRGAKYYYCASGEFIRHVNSIFRHFLNWGSRLWRKTANSISFPDTPRNPRLQFSTHRCLHLG